MKMRRAVWIAALIAANLIGIVSWQTIRAHPTTGAHRDLQCFADKVLAQTPPRAAIHFVLPPSVDDGGLINHRLRYALPGRYVSTDRDLFPSTRPPDWIATWRGGCEGTVERAGSR
jgi:hypothetical protein